MSFSTHARLLQRFVESAQPDLGFAEGVFTDIVGCLI